MQKACHEMAFVTGSVQCDQRTVQMSPHIFDKTIQYLYA